MKKLFIMAMLSLIASTFLFTVKVQALAGEYYVDRWALLDDGIDITSYYSTDGVGGYTAFSIYTDYSWWGVGSGDVWLVYGAEETDVFTYLFDTLGSDNIDYININIESDPLGYHDRFTYFSVLDTSTGIRTNIPLSTTQGAYISCDNNHTTVTCDIADTDENLIMQFSFLADTSGFQRFRLGFIDQEVLDWNNSLTYEQFQDIYYDEGYADGTTDGYASGLSDGESIGYADGYLTGQDDFYENGSTAYGYLITDSYDYEYGLIDGRATSVDSATTTFMTDFDKWIVPAIVIVLILGGFITASKMKKQGE